MRWVRCLHRRFGEVGQLPDGCTCWGCSYVPHLQSCQFCHAAEFSIWGLAWRNWVGFSSRKGSGFGVWIWEWEGETLGGGEDSWWDWCWRFGADTGKWKAQMLAFLVHSYVIWMEDWQEKKSSHGYLEFCFSLNKDWIWEQFSLFIFTLDSCIYLHTLTHHLEIFPWLSVRVAVKVCKWSSHEGCGRFICFSFTSILFGQFFSLLLLSSDLFGLLLGCFPSASNVEILGHDGHGSWKFLGLVLLERQDRCMSFMLSNTFVSCKHVKRTPTSWNEMLV